MGLVVCVPRGYLPRQLMVRLICTLTALGAGTQHRGIWRPFHRPRRQPTLPSPHPQRPRQAPRVAWVDLLSHLTSLAWPQLFPLPGTLSPSGTLTSKIRLNNSSLTNPQTSQVSLRLSLSRLCPRPTWCPAS